ncbi:MAG: FecR domain-containing protein [Chloroflexota bacterium]
MLTVVDGRVFVRHGDAGFEPAREGDLVAAGDTVRTASGASAEITYFEGSSVRVEADAEIVLMSLGTPDGGALQTLGRAWHVVTMLISGESRYEVRTPSSTASVRG